MQKTLYLDTARMGQMSPQALDASLNFARFAHEQGSTLYFSQFLKDGFSSWPLELQSQYPGLVAWDGVAKFQQRLRELAGANPHSDVFVASRSTFLMQCAARLMTGPCRNLLITDCTWPAYARILREQCQLNQTKLSVCPLRQQVLNEHCSIEDVIDSVTRTYLQQKCDGLFLPLIDNLGIRLPVERIVAEIREQSELRFVVVDGAQALGHVNPQLADEYCDFFIAGSHKWLRGCYPMGIGFCGRAGSRTYIADSLNRWQQSTLLADPLLNFTNELSGATVSRFGETVQVAPLIVANSAVCEALHRGESFVSQNRVAVTEVVNSAEWNVVDVAPEMRSNVLLIEALTEEHSPHQIRQALQTHGVAATVNDNRVVRISLPNVLLETEQLDQVQQTLTSIANQPAPVSPAIDQRRPITPQRQSGLTL